MASPINEHELDHLAELSRLELKPEEKPKLIKDLGNILAHFEELTELDTSHVEPLAGGALVRDVFREDTARENTLQGAGTENFPEKKDGYLKIPPVFE